ncbi:MAG: helix-turn-helix domain-containing protein [Nostoc sp.]
MIIIIANGIVYFLEVPKYRFYPTSEQEILLRRTMGCARLVYNRALAARTEAW